MTLPTEFHGTAVTPIDHASQKWLTAEEVGLCLGYNAANAGTGIRNLYNRHLDEFTDADTCRINLMRQGQNREVLIFSATGCIKLGFFASTKRAKDFRHWASQVLAGQSPASPPAARPAARQVASNGRLLITRAIEFEVLTLFVAGLPQKTVAQQIGISTTAVSLLLHGRYRFTPGAGQDLTTPELLRAVADRHVAADLERLTRKYCASAVNQDLETLLDQAGQRLLLS